MFSDKCKYCKSKIYHLLIYTHSPFIVTIIQKPIGIGYAAKMSHINYSGI